MSERARRSARRRHAVAQSAPDDRNEKGTARHDPSVPVAADLRRVAAEPPKRRGKALLTGQMLGLQATHGNQYVQRLVGGTRLRRLSGGGVLAREPAEAAAVAEAGTTVFKPVVNKTYAVAGKTLAEAVAGIEAYQKVHGEAGLTEWNPKLDYKLDESRNVKSASVVVTITVTMPSWPGAANLSAAAKAEWDRAYKELAGHEQEHVKIVKDQLTGVGESLIGKSETEAKAAFKKALADLKTASDAIDPFNVEIDTSIE